ncbi:type VI secretion system tip protein VgrG [Candidatus Methylospira mobilis]|uniref:Type VI secretion system tip protein VgrG n=1 Tax=Candidatus Methylospira mobilis TaxID=1808979 RepID=A0A5Q0BRP1_9GAMM|nr:type VI secretion system tip protein TssI/VgrG [Candidatus Methylospira mobilis]QFY44738.1 type VI secretion system tip protein VgrG [Candidatus Methylospira mobilis]
MITTAQISGTERYFGFEAANFPPDTFQVVRFEGEESISELYRFELLLASRDADINETTIVGIAAKFSLDDGYDDKKPTVYYGLIQQFTLLYKIDGWVLHKVVLMPKLWKLDMYHLSEVYLDKTRQEIFISVLLNGGLKLDDIEVRIPQPPEPLKLAYTCQYQESYLTFIARWFERLGIYWWYEEINGQEKIIFANNKLAHTDRAMRLHYLPPGELDDAPILSRRIQSLIFDTQCLPRKVLLMGYNQKRASQEVRGSAEVDEKGIGEVYLYGELLRSDDDAEKVARLRAEGIRCRGKQYHGSSNATGLRCGHFMEVSGHFRAGCNRRFLVTRVRHQGSQALSLFEKLRIRTPEPAEQNFTDDFYVADFTAIPSDVQFRPELRHPIPRIEGTLNAFIDAEGSGKYAELNERGEYKVQLPYDITDKITNKGSAWIRMASPYAGSDHGMHFPLHKGTEVLLSFENGNPDKPVILGAVCNSLYKNVVIDENQKHSVIQTGGGNSLEFHDNEGAQGIHLFSPVSNTKISIGAPLPEAKGGGADATVYGNSNPGAGYNCGGAYFSTSGDMNFTCENSFSNILGTKTSNVLGVSTSMYEGLSTSTYLLGAFSTYIGFYKPTVLGYKYDNIFGVSFKGVYGTNTDVIIGDAFKVVTGVTMEAFKTKVSEANSKLEAANFLSVTCNIKATQNNIKTAANAFKEEKSGVEKKAAAVKSEEIATKFSNVITKLDETATEVSNVAAKVETLGTEVTDIQVAMKSGVQILVP